MEDVVQILVFIAIILSVIISKYKEVSANRPGQTGQKPARSAETVREGEEDFPEDFNQKFDDFEDSDEKFEELNEYEEEFSPVQENEQTASQEEKPVVFDIPSSWKDILGIPPVTPSQQMAGDESKLQPRQSASMTYHDLHSRSNNIQSQDTQVHTDSESVSPVTVCSTKAEKEPRIRMKTRSEARRAFIYSEIFNRKYE